MNVLDPAPRSLDRPRRRSLAIVVAACGSHHARPPSAAASATAAASAAAARSPPHRRRHRHPASRIPAGPGPNGGVVVRWFVGLGAGAPARSSSRPSRSSSTDFNAVAEGRLPRARDRTTTPSPPTSSRPQIAAGNAPDIIGPVGVEGLNLFRDQLLDLAPLIDVAELRHDRASTRSSSTSSSSARTAPRSACRSPSTRRSSTTTRTSSTRPSCRTRRPRSATCTRASRGTWTPSASSP